MNEKEPIDLGDEKVMWDLFGKKATALAGGDEDYAKMLLDIAAGAVATRQVIEQAIKDGNDGVMHNVTLLVAACVRWTQLRALDPMAADNFFISLIEEGVSFLINAVREIVEGQKGGGDEPAA